MNLVKKFSANDFSSSYSIKIYQDKENNRFVAILDKFSHAFMSPVEPNDSTPIMEDLGSEKIIHKNLDTLIELCKEKVGGPENNQIIFNELPIHSNFD